MFDGSGRYSQLLRRKGTRNLRMQNETFGIGTYRRRIYDEDNSTPSDRYGRYRTYLRVGSLASSGRPVRRMEQLGSVPKTR